MSGAPPLVVICRQDHPQPLARLFRKVKLRISNTKIIDVAFIQTCEFLSHDADLHGSNAWIREGLDLRRGGFLAFSRCSKCSKRALSLRSEVQFAYTDEHSIHSRIGGAARSSLTTLSIRNTVIRSLNSTSN